MRPLATHRPPVEVVEHVGALTIPVMGFEVNMIASIEALLLMEEAGGVVKLVVVNVVFVAPSAKVQLLLIRAIELGKEADTANI